MYPKRRIPPPLVHPYANITAWASNVQPGSPPPCSPPHRRRSSSSRRRPARIPLQLSPATGEYPSDLTAVGYTSLFVHFDRTPTTPSPFKSHGLGFSTPLTGDVFGSIPIPPVPPLPQNDTPAKPAKRIGFPRFPSLGILRPKQRKASAQVPPPLPQPAPLASPKFAKKAEAAAAVAQRKQAKYAAKTTPSAKKPPPSLANELALMQFIDGGSMEDNAKRVMEARAKAIGVTGVEAVHRDEKGGIWYDADEEMEYAHLLGPEEDQGDWEEQNENNTVVVGPVVKSTSPNSNAYYYPIVRRSPTSTRTTSTSPMAISPISPRKFAHSTQALLSLPSRPRRNLRRPALSKVYAHLSHSPTFLTDVDAFAPRSPNPKSPRAVAFAVGSNGGTVKQSLVGNKKHRPRPAPLQLSSSQSAHARANAKVALVALNGKRTTKKVMTTTTRNTGSTRNVTGLSPSSLDKARREFVEDSFKPGI